MPDAPTTPLARLLRLAETRSPRLLAPRLRQASLDAGIVERRILHGKGPSPLVRRDARVREPRAVHAHVVRVEAPVVPSARHRVTILDGGSTHVCAPDTDEFVLAAALAAGIEMPFSCALGGCGACKVRLVEGDYTVEEPSCLTDEERAAGFVLTCVGRAHSPCTLEIVR